MTDEERLVLDALVVAWNAFVALPVEHPDDHDEFRHSIHVAQEKVLCRPARRSLNGAS